MKLVQYVPAIGWLRRYDRGVLGQDLLAAVIVTIMLVPQSLAYALLAGLPPQYGLYASVLPLIAYAVFGSSRALAVGPVAVISLMTAAAVSRLAEPGSDQFIFAAIALATLSGLMLILMGVLRLGFLASLLSHPVISGFITASGILIASSQIKHLLGIPVSGHNLIEIWGGIFAGVSDANLITLALGGAATAFLFWVRGNLQPLLRRLGLGAILAGALAKAGPVAAIIATTVTVATMRLDHSGVSVVGVIPEGMPAISIPGFDADLWWQLLPAAFLISVIGFVESVSVAQTLAAKRRQRVDPNQELIGLGAANIASAISAGFPVTGGFSRSVVNFDAGAQTPMAGVFTAVGIAVTALFLTPLFIYLPKATLAATIIVAVLSLVDLGAIRRTWHYSKSDFAAMALTILLVFVVGVEAGVVAGVCASIALYLWRTARPHMAVVGQVPGSEHFRNIQRHDVACSDRVLSVRVDESLYFANARHLEDRIYDMTTDQCDLTDVVLLCPAVNFIDASALESLENLMERLSANDIRFHLSDVKGPVMDRLKRCGFTGHLTGEVWLTHHAAMSALDRKTTEIADCGSLPFSRDPGHEERREPA